MARIENESEEFSLESIPARTPPSSWDRPLMLAGLGLVLMLGGYAAMNYVPTAQVTPRQAEQERQLADLRGMAAKERAGGTTVDGLSDRLDQITPPWRTPPYQIPGRLALFGGLFLFVAAGVLMYRHSPSKPHEGEQD
jgi:hypothetical protein